MVISMDVSAFQSQMGIRLSRGRLAASARFMIVLLFLAAVAAPPALAKKKKYRYAPPQAAMVVDLYTGKVLYTQNADKPRFPASITKVMTLYMLFEQMRAGKMTMQTKLKVSSTAASRPPSKLGLKPGSTISVQDAMYALVTKSANDVAAVVAENIGGSEAGFARLMTQKARSIGMTKTTFRNASGLPNSEQKTTARDLITLGRTVLRDFPEQSKIFRTRYFQYGKKRYRNHNRLLFSYAGMEGMKTGFTRASGFNLLASCRRDDKHLLAVVLGGRSSRHRNGRMASLLNASWKKAVSFNELRQGGGLKPMSIAGILQPGLMPERNPAFHPSDAERQLLEVTITRVQEPEKPRARDLSQIALASSVASAPLRRAEVKAQAAPQQRQTREQDQTDDPTAHGPYHVQVGSFLDTASARQKLTQVSSKASSLLTGHNELTVSGDVKGRTYFRARFGGFARSDASQTCTKLKRMSIDCLVVRVE